MADDNDRNTKRKNQSIISSNKKQKVYVEDERPLCKYGESCYQKNAFHLNKYRHPYREENVELLEEDNLKNPEGGDKTETSPCTKQDTNEQNSGPSVSDEENEDNGENFLTDMPEDFYSFWQFCSSLNEKTPCSALKELLGLELVGPFELLNKSDCALSQKVDYLNNWRFYYDPPEFQCILVGDSTSGYHIGYFRDSPSEMPVFVGSSTEAEGCIINQLGDNLFTSLGQLINEKLKKANPFHKTNLVKLKKQLDNWVKEHNILSGNKIMKERSKKVVAKTFYQCGIVVPVDKKSRVGYRDIPETNATIKKICKKIVDSKDSAEQDANFDPLQELVRYVQYANDELDYGMGLELGLDLLAFGGEVFHSTILHLLGVAYELLERPEFLTVLKVHLASRKRIASKE